MTKKSKSNRNKSYVEIRNKARKALKMEIAAQLGPKDRQSIINSTGLSHSAVYKALNINDNYWSPAAIQEAEKIIKERTTVEL